jgi:PDZ domain
LKENDYICKINSKDCTNFSKRMIFKAIRASFPQCVITVKRQKMSARRLCSVQLSLAGNRNHGLTFDCGLYISRIDPNSAAGKDGKLSVGDRILSINNKKLESIKNVNDVYSYLNEIRSNMLNIVAIKDCTSATEAPTTSSQQQMKRANSRQYNKMINSCTQTENFGQGGGGGNSGGRSNAIMGGGDGVGGNGNSLGNNNAMSNSTSSSSNGGK